MHVLIKIAVLEADYPTFYLPFYTLVLEIGTQMTIEHIFIEEKAIQTRQLNYMFLYYR